MALSRNDVKKPPEKDQQKRGLKIDLGTFYQYAKKVGRLSGSWWDRWIVQWLIELKQTLAATKNYNRPKL